MFETYFKNLKGGQLLAWAGGAAVAVLQFCRDHGIPQQQAYIAAAVAAAVVAVAFFINPKALSWASPDGPPDLATTVRAIVSEMQSGSGGPRTFSPPPRPAYTAEQLADAEAILRAAGKL